MNRSDIRLLWWLSMCPWASARDLAEFARMTVSTVNRRLDALYGQGKAVSRMVGRGDRAKRRWILASEYLEGKYATGHRHGGHTGVKDHRHNPLDSLVDGHSHVPWPLNQAGINELHNRLPYVSAFYEIAPRLFAEAGPEWMAEAVGNEPVPLTWSFLRRGQLVEAVAVYQNRTQEFTVAFCWLGRQLKPARMLEKWHERFANVRYTSVAGELYREWGRCTPPDPDFDPTPQPSCYVMAGADEYSVRQAMKLIPRDGYLHENAFSWWVAGDPCRKIGESGRVWPEGDWICDRFENVTLGEPERAAPPGTGGDRDAPPFPPSLSMVLPYRILALAEDHPAITEEDAEDILGEKPEAVDAAFAALVKDGLLARVQDVYYLGGSALIHVAARDRISVTSVRQRLFSYLDEDMQRHLHDLAHNRGMWRIVRSLHRHGIKVYGGWRGVRNFPGLTQIQPDGLLYADGPWGETLYFLEYERTATTPEQVSNKLRPYRRASDQGVRFPVIWITETRRAATRIVQRAQGRLDVMAATLEELKTGPIAGENAIWRSSASGSVELKSY